MSGRPHTLRPFASRADHRCPNRPRAPSVTEVIASAMARACLRTHLARTAICAARSPQSSFLTRRRAILALIKVDEVVLTSSAVPFKDLSLFHRKYGRIVKEGSSFSNFCLFQALLLCPCGERPTLTLPRLSRAHFRVSVAVRPRAQSAK